LNQKWIFYNKNYFRGTKGIVKGKISWKTIEKEVYDRENMPEEFEIVDEEQLFEMNIEDFYKMLNKQKGKRELKKKNNYNYRTNDFQTNKDYVFEVTVPYETFEYMERVGLDIQLQDEYRTMKIMLSSHKIIWVNGSFRDIKFGIDKLIGLQFGLIIRMTINIKSHKALIRELNKTYITKLPKREIKQSKSSY
jgi:hypothetical protein